MQTSDLRQSRQRYAAEMDFHGPISPPRGLPPTPVTLLIPEELYEILLERLAPFRRHHGSYLKLLLDQYRGHAFERALAQSGCVKAHYQKPGLELRRFSVRVDNRTWVELGSWAAYLGVSRCLLFTWLLELDSAADTRDTSFVGVPTSEIQAYDLARPGKIEFTCSIEPRMNSYRRGLRLTPVEAHDLPVELYLSIQYPQYFASRGRIRDLRRD